MSTPVEKNALLRQVVTEQRFAVLATMNHQQPYSNLVAFTVTDDLRILVFATNRNTRKYQNILSNNQVAILIDNRRNRLSDFSRALAVTVLGTASESGGEERKELTKTYLNRHRSLADFLKREDTAIIRVSVNEYILASFDGAERIQVDNVSSSPSVYPY